MLLLNRWNIDRRNVDNMVFLLLEEEPAKSIFKFEKYLRVCANEKQHSTREFSAEYIGVDELGYIDKTKLAPPTRHPLLTAVTPAIPKYTSIHQPEVKILQDYINSKKHSKFCKTPTTHFA